jgi:type I restriction-modification system DNA methylase subunit/restriction endonuclease S subunit
MARSTVHYADSETNNILKRLHNNLRPAGTPVERVEYIIELLLLRIFEAKVKQEEAFSPLRKLFGSENYRLLFSHLISLNGEQILSELNKNIFPFYATILSKARTVISGNLPQKMQDQLVLMEEVFANSNFTNNVKGGVIAEVIGLVSEIDEKYILKTDLLGDAIESALSETGGTKDLGLFRTPDHIRKMMVEMVDPDFTDTIFDPACGTAGFLFDAYEYVIQKAQKTRQFPAEHIANNFYRTGIGGIEYQGRIRKMAAVNMYIRGLNPHNIDQGDSLKMFDPLRDGGSKSVVIANPPFGAERDQPAYPNVWEEYSKESETTILFVKLMFDLLKQNGRCAVVVSEGFLTWGQNSACALRRLLLSEANLRAVISLPQGVFVSKGGQGAKTSILYFEKGQPTDFVWYYKIENDGFSMGTNRKSIEGNQIPELLTLFKEVMQGKKPKDTKHSFCVSKEQIETLDPRIAERIRKEVSEKTKEKNTKKRTKLVEGLNKKLEGKKIKKEMYDEKLWQFDNLIEGQIDNEVAKAIEKAHSYHFNLQNYRSNISAEQIKEWQETLKGVVAINGLKIEKRYQELNSADPKVALQILASFDPKDGLHMDMARVFLNKVDKQDEKLNKLNDILRRGHQYPIVSLKDWIIINDEKVKPAESPEIEFTVLGVSNETGVFINEKLQGSAIKQSYFKVYKNQFCYNPYRINVGSIGFSEFDIENQIISGAYNVFGCKESELNPKYLGALFMTKKFLDYVNEKANGGVRMDFKIEYMQEWQIPLPPLEIQNEIVKKIGKQMQIIEGARILIKLHEPFINIPDSVKLEPIGDAVIETKNGWSPVCNGGEQLVLSLSCLKCGKIDFLEVKETSETINNISNYYVKEGDFFYSRGNTKELVALAAIATNVPDRIIFPDLMTRVRFEEAKIIPQYAVYLFNSEIGRNYFGIVPEGGTPSMIKVSADYMKGFPVPYIGDLNSQRQIVEKNNQWMQALEGVRGLKAQAEKRIEEMLAEVWGDALNSLAP